MRLRDMLDACYRAIEFTRLRTRADLESDEVLVHALVNLLTIIGEASIHVFEASCAENTQIAWRQIEATRNRVVHGYWQVDLDVLWQIVSGDLPVLISQLERIVAPA